MQLVLSIDGRSVNGNALFFKGKMHYCRSPCIAGNKIQFNTQNYGVSVRSPLVERQNLKSILKELKGNEHRFKNSSYLRPIQFG